MMNERDQIATAYRMFAKARYRPCAPSDGFGNLTVPLGDLDFDAEVKQYAAEWMDAENRMSYFIGCPDSRDRVAMILAVELARLCCGGVFANRDVMKSLAASLRDEIDSGGSVDKPPTRC